MPTSGGRPNTEFIRSLASDALTDRGHIKVKPTLELLNFPGIFAAGDAIDWKEQKQAAKAPAHAAVIAANIISYLSGKAPSKVYKGSLEMIAIPIGRVSSHLLRVHRDSHRRYSTQELVISISYGASSSAIG